MYSKKENGMKFEATISGVQSSNEMIIQQLEELLKNDCNIAETSANNSANEYTKSVGKCADVASLDTATVMNLAFNAATGV